MIKRPREPLRPVEPKKEAELEYIIYLAEGNYLSLPEGVPPETIQVVVIEDGWAKLRYTRPVVNGHYEQQMQKYYKDLKDYEHRKEVYEKKLKEFNKQADARKVAQAEKRIKSLDKERDRLHKIIGRSNASNK
jgi:hypothetical protein